MTDSRLNANPRVDEAHHRVSSAGFKYYVTELVCEAAGGPQTYSGRTMGDSHRHLVITDEEWLAFMDDLQKALDRFESPRSICRASPSVEGANVFSTVMVFGLYQCICRHSFPFPTDLRC
jgi:hypothetical protein